MPSLSYRNLFQSNKFNCLGSLKLYLRFKNKKNTFKFREKKNTIPQSQEQSNSDYQNKIKHQFAMDNKKYKQYVDWSSNSNQI